MRFIASILTLAVALAPTGCKSIAALKQRCLSGDASSCESACAKGIAGEGGCFHAGNIHREQAALDFAGAEFRRASGYFMQACNGGYADGCLLAAQMIEAPYAPDPSAAGNDAPKMISDDEVRNREKRFDQACSRGSAPGCKRLGDVLIGKNADRAKAAYAKACAAGAAPAECKTARSAEVDRAEQFRIACTRRVADDCSRLGYFLYQVDPPRAVRLFAAEYQLRGLADVADGVAAFVRDRLGDARFASAAVTPATSPQGPATHSFDVGSPSVSGPVAVTEVLHDIASHAPDLSRCVDLPGGKPPEELGLEFIVDLTGDVYAPRVTASGISSDVARCVEAVFDGMTFAMPRTPAKVTLSLLVRPAKTRAPG